MHSSRSMDNEKEQLASEEEITTHNSSGIELRNKFQRTFQNREKTSDKTRTGRKSANLKQGRFSHSTENSSEESEKEEQKTKKVKRKTKKTVATKEFFEEESNKMSKEPEDSIKDVKKMMMMSYKTKGKSKQAC